MIPQRPPARPVGVILTAVALGLVAAVLLLGSLGSLIGLASGASRAAMVNSGTAASASLITVMTLLFGFLYLAVAVWCIVTVIGLVRMRSWARVSTIVIAICVAGFSLLAAVGTLLAQSVLSSGSVPMPPNIDPALFHKAFILLGAVCLVVAALAIAAVVYFVGRRTREAFALFNAPPAYPPQPYGYPPAEAYAGQQPDAYPPPHAWPTPAPPPARDPLTDFTVARPIQVPVNPTGQTPQPPSSNDPHSTEGQ